MMDKLKIIPGYVTEQEACEMLGHKFTTLRAYCKNPSKKRYDIRILRPAKSKFYYHRKDIITTIKMKSI